MSHQRKQIVVFVNYSDVIHIMEKAGLQAVEAVRSMQFVVINMYQLDFLDEAVVDTILFGQRTQVYRGGFEKCDEEVWDWMLSDKQDYGSLCFCIAKFVDTKNMLILKSWLENMNCFKRVKKHFYDLSLTGKYQNRTVTYGEDIKSMKKRRYLIREKRESAVSSYNRQYNDFLELNKTLEPNEYCSDIIDEFNNKLNGNNNLFAIYNTEIEQCNTKINECENKKIEYTNKINEWRGKILEYKNTINRYNSKILEYENRIKGYNIKIDEVENNVVIINEYKGKIEEYNNKINQCNNGVDEYHDKIDQYNYNINEYNDKVDVFNENIFEMNETIDDYNDKIEELDLLQTDSENEEYEEDPEVMELYEVDLDDRNDSDNNSESSDEDSTSDSEYSSGSSDSSYLNASDSLTSSDSSDDEETEENPPFEMPQQSVTATTKQFQRATLMLRWPEFKLF